MEPAFTGATRIRVPLSGVCSVLTSYSSVVDTNDLV